MVKPKIGDEFYLVDCGNNARYDGGQQRTCIVTKVGNKYFYVEHGDTYKGSVTFRIEDRRQKSDFCDNYKLYENKKAYEDHKEVCLWQSKFSEIFRNYNCEYSLDKYRSIAEILGITL